MLSFFFVVGKSKKIRIGIFDLFRLVEIRREINGENEFRFKRQFGHEE